jgi:predicted lipoprotein with Yx(FWY)xxD motif
MRTSLVPLGAALLIGLAACGSGSGQKPSPDPHAQTAVGVKVDQSSLGSILTDQDGRTLYAFFNDKNGTSSCADQCVATWPTSMGRASTASGS